MSSPKAGAARRGKTQLAEAAAPAPVATEPSLSAEAKRLAAAIERGLAEGRADVLTPEALQALVVAICNTYAAQVEAGAEHFPLEGRTANSTAIMTMASGLLRSQRLAVFELGMWQSWTGR